MLCCIFIIVIKLLYVIMNLEDFLNKPFLFAIVIILDNVISIISFDYSNYGWVTLWYVRFWFYFFVNITLAWDVYVYNL